MNPFHFTRIESMPFEIENCNFVNKENKYTYKYNLYVYSRLMYNPVTIKRVSDRKLERGQPLKNLRIVIY